MKNIANVTIAAGLVVAVFLGASPARAQDQGYCREYTRNVVIGGQVQHAYGEACRQPDGTWQIMNQQQGDQVVEAAPPPQNAQVSYVIQDQQPIYVQPRYVQYAPYPYPYPDEYVYGYPFIGYDYYGGHYGGYDHGYYGHGGYGGGYGGHYH